MKIYLENRSQTRATEHNKFYQIEQLNCDVFCKWGAISSYRSIANQYTAASRIKIFNFATKADAKAKALEILENKKSKGYCEITRNNLSLNNRPTNGIQRKFGIEIETNTNLTKAKLCKKLKAKGLKARNVANYYQSDGKKWDVKNDSSCGYEIASPIINGEAGVFDLKLCIDKIKECLDGHLPDSKCGIHITVSTNDLNKEQLKNIIINFIRSEKHFYKMCNSSRQDNEYCQKYDFDKDDLEDLLLCRNLTEIKRTVKPDKYMGINLTKLPNCIEFRMFQSELSPRKVAKWTRTCIGFIENAANKIYSHENFLSQVAFEKLIKGDL